MGRGEREREEETRGEKEEEELRESKPDHQLNQRHETPQKGNLLANLLEPV